MSFFTKYSFFANFFFMFLVVTSILYISNKSLDGTDSIIRDFDLKNQVELIAYDFKNNRYDKDGNLKDSFTSKKLEKYVNQSVKLTNIIEKSYDKITGKINWQVKSNYALSKKRPGDNLVYLYGGVKAIMFSDKNGFLNIEDDNRRNSNYHITKVYISTDEMYYNTDSRNFYNDDFVKIYDPYTGNNTTCLGLKGNTNSKIIYLNQNVRSYYASS